MQDNLDAKTVVCLPTYNEAENLEAIVQAIRDHLPGSRILVIDDNSPDGTGEIAEELAVGNSQVQVLHRTSKEGLGRAYLEGFRKALADTEREFVVQMDADFSHPAERLPAMLDATREADLVIGSRYVEGGGIEDWGFHRQLLSRFGSLYSRLWCGLAVRDLTGGFKVWRRDLLEKVLVHSPCTSGYGFQVEMTFLAAWLGARIVELPIIFKEREDGQSKMTSSIAIEALWKIPLLRWRYRKVARTPGAME